MAWTTCECCGWAGVDEVTQFCIEEAAFERLEFFERRNRAGLPEDVNLDELVEEPSLHEQLGARHQQLVGEVKP